MLLNWYSSMKKKFRKIQMIFDIENWLWMSIFRKSCSKGSGRGGSCPFRFWQIRRLLIRNTSENFELHYYLPPQISRLCCIPPSVSRIFFRCLIFDCYNISLFKKGKVKDEASEKIPETNRTCIDFTNFI